MMNQIKAWKAGKPVMLSVPSPTNKHCMEKVPAIEVWGSPHKKVKSVS